MLPSCPNRQSAPMSPGEHPEESQYTALIVEDDVSLCHFMEWMLTTKMRGIRVLTAHDGPSAWKAYTRSRPDIVITGIMMPGFDGHELIGRIRATGDTALILVVTAADISYNRPKALAAGANAFLAKPIYSRVLVQTLSSLLSNSPPRNG